MTTEEEQRLIPSGSEKSEQGRAQWCFLFKLSIVLVLFKAAEELYKSPSKQYIFAWCERTSSDANDTGIGLNDTSNDNGSNKLCGHKDETEAQQQASQWDLYLNLLNSVLVYFSVSIYGTLSDYYGRKLFFCIALFGFMLRCGVTAAVIYFETHIAWLFAGYAADGLCGSLYAVSALTFAITADSTGTKSKDRVFGMTVMEAVFSIGRLSTQFSSGYFIDATGFFYPMLTATALSLFALILALAIISEPSKQKSEADEKSKQSLPSIGTLFRRYIGFYTNSRDKKTRRIFWICLIAFLLIEFGIISRSDPLTLYQLGDPFCWSAKLIGWYSAVYNFANNIVGCLILKLLQLCMFDPLIACLGTCSAIVYCVLTGLASSTDALFAGKSYNLFLGIFNMEQGAHLLFHQVIQSIQVNLTYETYLSNRHTYNTYVHQIPEWTCDQVVHHCHQHLKQLYIAMYIKRFKQELKFKYIIPHYKATVVPVVDLAVDNVTTYLSSYRGWLCG